ncbi:MAG: zinc metallopeptidase [Defluviitaleaceae bacterium]|nr:zinc metallopeptidase [Defluviitaleaceae bacterium]
MIFMPMDIAFIILVLPAIIFAAWAQYRVSSSFKKYSQMPTSNGLTGAQAAKDVLQQAGVTGVTIERIAGDLTDHYDPHTATIRLSESVYDKANVAAVGVAAHEAGHAIQHAEGYSPMKIRSAIIPVTNFGSRFAVPLVIAGFVLGIMGLVHIGIILFGAVVFFQLVTLPVEFNASNRAIATLDGYAMLTVPEVEGAKRVLSAAALTYVGALAISLAQLIRLILLRRR